MTLEILDKVNKCNADSIENLSSVAARKLACHGLGLLVISSRNMHADAFACAIASEARKNNTQIAIEVLPIDEIELGKVAADRGMVAVMSVMNKPEGHVQLTYLSASSTLR